MLYEIIIDGKPHRLDLTREGQQWLCTVDGMPVEANAMVTRPDVLSIVIDGHAYEVKRERTPSDTHLWVKNSRFAVEVRDPRSLRSRRAKAGSTEGPQKIIAPMPGKIVRILATAGAAVQAGQGIIVVEAMKMQNEMKSPKAGKVKQVLVADGATVNAGDVLAIIE
jgi:biotin carboxyl carrier protein